MQAEYEMKVQVIRSKGRATRLFVNIPLPLAAALDLLPRQRERTQFLVVLLAASFVAHRLQSAGGYAHSSRLANGQNPSQSIVFYPAVWVVEAGERVRWQLLDRTDLRLIRLDPACRHENRQTIQKTIGNGFSAESFLWLTSNTTTTVKAC